jgi:hypothetical protein
MLLNVTDELDTEKLRPGLNIRTDRLNDAAGLNSMHLGCASRKYNVLSWAKVMPEYTAINPAVNKIHRYAMPVRV